MQPNRIYAGTWVPRTQLHLQEFYYFLTGNFDELDLDKTKLSQLKKNLRIDNVIYQKGALDTISADFGPFEFHLLEDGTLILSKPIANIKTDTQALAQFLLTNTLTAFSYIYSRGAPIPKIFTSIESILPLIITLSRTTKDQVTQIFNDLGDHLNHQVKDVHAHAFFGTNLTVLVGPSQNHVKLIRYLIFIHEHSNQLNRLLKIHRSTWENISTIREHERVQFKDLPGMRDQLLDIKKDISFFSSRLAQLDTFLTERKRVIRDYIPRQSLQTFINSELSSLLATQKYLVDLWKMTSDYADSTLNLISMLYQENEHKEINMLQVIFIIGVMASLLTLGAMPGANITTRDPNGNLISIGSLESFNLSSLLTFGALAFLASIVLYYLLHLTFTRLKSFRVIDTTRHRTKTADSIKKLLSV